MGTKCNLKEALSREEKTVIELAAIGTFLHNIYNGVENILKQILKSKGIAVQTSDTWHKELLNFSDSQVTLSEQPADSLYEYLTFRHIFVHTYGFMLDEDQLKDTTSLLKTRTIILRNAKPQHIQSRNYLGRIK